MVMLVMMVTAEQQHNAANDHEHAKDRLTVVLQYMLNTLRLRTHDERNRQQDISHQLAQNEHCTVQQHLAFVSQLTVDVTDCSYTGKKRTWVQNCQQTQQ